MYWPRLLVTMVLGVVVPVLAQPVADQPVKTIRIDVSAGTVSMWTEIPGGDHLIPDSQVFIGGRGGASRWLGLLGLAIDAGRNEAATGEAASALRVKFDATVVKVLKALAARNFPPEVNLVIASDPYDLRFLPSARFDVHDDKQADLGLRITARFKNERGEETKNYYYAVPELRPLAGPGSWTENNADVFRSQAEAGFGRLVEAVAQDAAGRYAEARAPDRQRKIKVAVLRSGQAFDAVLLDQTEQVVVVIPMFRGRPLTALVQVFDRAAVKTEGP